MSTRPPRPTVRGARRAPRTVLLTGFEPFAGFDRNPGALIVEALDGRRIAGARIVGRVLPVDLRRIDAAIADVLARVQPDAVVALGLAASEPVSSGG